MCAMQQPCWELLPDTIRWMRPVLPRRFLISQPRATRTRKGLRIGVPAEYFAEGLDPEVRAAIEKGIEALEKAGCSIKTISLPHTKYAIPTYYLVATAEASANLARFDGVRYGYRSPASERLPTCTATRATRALAPR